MLSVPADFLSTSLPLHLERSETEKTTHILLMVVKLALSFQDALTTAVDGPTIGEEKIVIKTDISSNIMYYFAAIMIIHRIIVDGPGSGTVFNGPVPLLDAMYTSASNYITGNHIVTIVHEFGEA